MKKIFLTLSLLLSLPVSALEFEACGEEWRIHHYQEEGVLVLNIKKDNGNWGWTVNREYDGIIKANETVDEFIDKFIITANNKLDETCSNLDPDIIPSDWEGYLTYSVNHRLYYDASNNTIVFK